MSAPRIIDCADCGELRPNYGRGLCRACCGRRSRAGTLDEFPPMRKPLAVGVACRNGHPILSEADLCVNSKEMVQKGVGGKTCRICRRKTQADYDAKRFDRPLRHACPRCGTPVHYLDLCRDCRDVEGSAS